MPPLRIAVIDNDPALLQAVEVELRAGGYQVLCLQASTTAVEQLPLFKPHLIFLSASFPKDDGKSLGERLRSIAGLRQSKIVPFSSHIPGAARHAAAALGADDFFESPREPVAFLAKAQALLGRQVGVRFWGTRGSIAAPSPETVRYGGNTSCVEILLPEHDELLVIDAGTGLRVLGNAKLRERKEWHGHIFISHTHWDHIQGLPFFSPWYLPGNSFTIVSTDQNELPLEKVIAGQMISAYFPVDFERLGADIAFKKLTEGDHTINRLRVETLLANHPNVTLMFKFHLGGKTLVYATDNELQWPNEKGVDPMAAQRARMVEFFRGADLLIHDAQYTDDEYRTKRGWGHSSWREALDIAIRSDVKQLVFFHHDPDHTDEMLDRISAECGEELEKRGIKLPVCWAKEGEEVLLETSPHT